LKARTADSLGNRDGIGDAQGNFMKPRCSKNQNRGLTLLEVLVVIFLLAIIAALLLPALSRPKTHARLSCVNNLKEISLAFRIWEGDNGDFYPMAVSCTNGGTMEQAATGNVAAVFGVMSNELSTPKILFCPADEDHFEATNFSEEITAKNISYFINVVDATEANPQMLLTGDDNFEINGVPVKSGILELTTNNPVFWTNTRHKLVGNVAITDGSVQQLGTKGLQDCSSLTTNRIAIP
jgi:prepilin-type N-terminal cleavage/methylation domain-containing protein